MRVFDVFGYVQIEHVGVSLFDRQHHHLFLLAHSLLGLLSFWVDLLRSAQCGLSHQRASR